MKKVEPTIVEVFFVKLIFSIVKDILLNIYEYEV